MRSDPTHLVKFTYDHLSSFAVDFRRHEIIDGDHYVTHPPNTKHQTISGRLACSLGMYLQRQQHGEVFMAPFDVVLSDVDVVVPDLLYISRERLEILTEENVRGVPDLIVEILSVETRKTDEVTKRNLYGRFGVREYWVVDPELDAIKLYRRFEQAFLRVAELSLEHQDALTTPLLPDWSESLARIFAPPFSALRTT